MKPGWLLAAFAFGSVGCSGSEAKPSAERADGATPDSVYEPSATEVPLASDFAAAAAGRVNAESYRRELARIAHELEVGPPAEAQRAR